MDIGTAPITKDADNDSAVDSDGNQEVSLDVGRCFIIIMTYSFEQLTCIIKAIYHEQE